MDKLAVLAFVRPFFQKTLGFWTLVLLIGGVLMEPAQHLLIGRFLFKNPLAFWVLPLSMLLFGWTHLRIQLDLIRKNDYLVFHHLGIVSRKEFWGFWSKILLLNFSPILAYYLFLSFFALEQKALFLGSVLWLVTIGALLFNFVIIQKTLHQPLKEVIIHRPAVRWTFPRFTWILLSLRQHRPVLFLLSKASSLILLNGFFYSFQSGDYDIRWLQFGVLCTTFIQIPLVLDKTEKEQAQQPWTLGLPLSLGNKMGYQIGSLALMVFPELLFLVWKSVFSSDPLKNIFLGIFLLTLISGIQALIYQKKESSSFPNLLAGLFFLVFLAIIFSLPAWVFALVIFSLFIHQTNKAYHF